MRLLGTNLLLALALLGVASPLNACCCGPDVINFPGVARSAILRNNHLLCVNDKNRVIAVDLLNYATFDLGPSEDRRWGVGDVADGQALLLSSDRLYVVHLADGKTVHEMKLVGGHVYNSGFAGRGRAFLHRGHSLDLIELATGKTLHTVELGKSEDWHGIGVSAWQKVGERLFVVGPNSALCVIDLTTGTPCERFQVESRGGIQDFRVEGDLVYCIGSPQTWAAKIDHLTCFNLKTKQTRLLELPRIAKRGSRLAGGPKGSVYLTDGKQMDRFDALGRWVGTWTAPGETAVLAVWENQVITAAKDVMSLQYVRETPVASK